MRINEGCIRPVGGWSPSLKCLNPSLTRTCFDASLAGPANDRMPVAGCRGTTNAAFFPGDLPPATGANLGSLLTAHRSPSSSRSPVHGSRFTVHGSRLTAHRSPSSFRPPATGNRGFITSPGYRYPVSSGWRKRALSRGRARGCRPTSGSFSGNTAPGRSAGAGTADL